MVASRLARAECDLYRGGGAYSCCRLPGGVPESHCERARKIQVWCLTGRQLEYVVESDVRLPARMVPLIREALDGYEQGKQGPGQHSFAELLASTHRSVIRFEMRDSYDQTVKGFAEWQATGDTGAYEWGDHLDVARAAVARGVTIRRVRVVSEPLSDYLRWEHACTDVNVSAGEDVRWLPRTKAADLLLPGADCWVFDHRVVRWNFQRGDGTNPRHYAFSSDPRTIRDIVAAFEMAWDRATPHEECKAD